MTDTRTIPADLFARTQIITGLRALADFLETNPGVPVNEYGFTINVPLIAGTDDDKRAEVDRVASVMDVTPHDDTAKYGHYIAKRSFGRIAYQVYYSPARTQEHFQARDSYADNIHCDRTEAA